MSWYNIYICRCTPVHLQLCSMYVNIIQISYVYEMCKDVRFFWSLKCYLYKIYIQTNDKAIKIYFLFHTHAYSYIYIYVCVYIYICKYVLCVDLSY